MSALNDIISDNVLQSLPVGLLIVDQTGSIVTVNPAAVRILGFSEAELIGKGWGELFFYSEDNFRFNQVIVDVIQNELVGLIREVPFVTPSGKTLQLSITSSYLQSEAGLLGIVVILHDVTDLYLSKQREYETLKEKNRIQEDKIRCLSKLAASVAHQIRNPAFAIGGFAGRLAELLKKNAIDSAYPAIIRDEAKRLETIVKTVGRFAALSQPHFDRRSLPAILKEARDAAEARAAALGRTVVFRGSLPEVDLVADPKLLAAAFKELFCNSLEFADKDEVEVSVCGLATDETVRLTVADNGPGIAPCDRAHVFDPFYSTRPDGAGMGLALVLEILLEHSGDIVLEPGAPGGACFTITLPRFPSRPVGQPGPSPRGADAPDTVAP